MLGAALYVAVVKQKSGLERLTRAVRHADAEFDAAVRPSDVKAAANVSSAPRPSSGRPRKRNLLASRLAR